MHSRIPRYCEVALPTPLDRTLTYAVPEALASRVAVGMRALVPLRKRIETGYIVAVAEATRLEETKPILDLPDEGPVFTASMVELCRWLADYYCCAWGEALHGALPAGLQLSRKVRYVLQHDALSQGRYTERQRKLIAALYRNGPMSERQLAKEVGAAALSNTLQSLVRRAVLRVEALAMRQQVNVNTVTWARLVEAAVPEPEALEALQRRAPKQAAVYLDLLNEEPERAATDLYARHGASAAVLRALEERGLVERFERELYRRPSLEEGVHSAPRHTLNDEQRAALEAMTAAMDAESFATFLLRGVTGSGKTEVYLQAIEHALELGRDAIILVPEISLTPQTVGRFKSRFHEAIAVLHSGLGAGERYDEWRRAQRGEVRIVVGARSAIFAPLPRLGIVVVDEEHDTSYKQGEAPRYHARDVAIMRAKMAKGICVLGSATPSIEASYNARRGKSALLELTQRATSGRLPEVRLVDMRDETRAQGADLILSRHLEEAVMARVHAREQVILLLNRRGFAPFVLCPQCGWVSECTDCNVTMTYHASGAHLQCHYCGRRDRVPQVCGQCHFNPLLFLGTGTQKVEDYLMRSFPGARVQRMDADTTAGKGGHAEILGRFAAGEIDILIGTQMIAKGHDYPGVTLVGVINGDTGLSLPDFRGAENTFQLLTQVAGRAGRGDKPGEVLIQTYRPNHFAVQCAAHHDYDAFLSRELLNREQAGYPPFRRMANLLIECEDADRAERATMALARVVLRQIETLDFRGVQMLGPSPATIRRVKKQFRWNLGLLSKSAARLNQLVRSSREAFAQEPGAAGVKLKVDLDPYNTY